MSLIVLRAPHFVGLHAFQVLPLIALLLVRTGWDDAGRTRLIFIGAAGYLSSFALLLSQALQGRPVLGLDATAISPSQLFSIVNPIAACAWLLLAIQTGLEGGVCEFE